MRRLFLILSLSAALAVPSWAAKPFNSPWIIQSCVLSSLNSMDFAYLACGDTTTETALGRAFALRLDPSPDMIAYRNYRELERISHSLTIATILVMGADIFLTKVISSVCSPSMNPSCENASLTTFPWYYYAGAFTLEVPIAVFTSNKRLHFQDILVEAYNRKVLPQKYPATLDSNPP